MLKIKTLHCNNSKKGIAKSPHAKCWLVLGLTLWLQFMGAALSIAQFITVRGLVQYNGKPLAGAVVLYTKDSAAYRIFALSAANGQFSLQVHQDSLPGMLQVSALNTITQYQRILNTNYQENWLFTVYHDTTGLPPVEVVTKQPIKVRGDTTSFMVQAFAQGHENSLASLLAQMPGFTIEPDGTIKFRGKQINRVLFQKEQLGGNDYRQLVQQLGIKGLREVQVIDRYADADDILAESLSPRLTALNLEYEDTVLPKPTGYWTTAVAMPVGFEASGQWLQLKSQRGAKQLWLGGYTTAGNPQFANAHNLQGTNTNEANAQNSAPALPALLTVAPNSPMPKLPNVFFNSLQGGNGQYNWVQSATNGWRWRFNAQPGGTAAHHITNNTNQIIASAQSITQTEATADSWRQLGGATTLRASKVWQQKKQVIVELNNHFNRVTHNGSYSFLQTNGKHHSSHVQNQTSLNIIYNLKQNNQSSHRFELAAMSNWLPNNYGLQNELFLSALAGTAANANLLEQHNRLTQHTFTLTHQYKPSSQWILKSQLLYGGYKANTYWYFFDNQQPLTKQTDSLPNGTLGLVNLATTITRLAKPSHAWELQYGLKAEAFRIYSNDGLLPKTNTRLFVLPHLQVQYKINQRTNITVAASSNSQPFMQWPAFEGQWLAGRSSLHYSPGILAVKPGWQASIFYHYFPITSKKPALFANVLYLVMPVFAVPNLQPGLVFNGSHFNPFNKARNLVHTSATIQSPLINTDNRISATLAWSWLLNYNQINGNLRQVPFNQFTINTKWQRNWAKWITTQVEQQAMQQLQKAQNGKSIAAFLYQLNGGITVRLNSRWHLLTQYHHFFNKAGSSASFGQWQAQAAYKWKNWEVFAKGTNLTNQQQLQYTQVAQGFITTQAVAALGRFMLLGVRKTF